MCTGPPCTAGIRELSLIAVVSRPGGIGRIDTTMGPASRPAGRHQRLVTYMGTLRLCSIWRSGTPAAASAHSKVKLHPIRNATRSSRQYRDTSRGSATSSPSRHTW